MGTLTINGQKVRVDDSFGSLTPEQQEATVNEIAAQISGQSASGTATAEPPPAPSKVPLPFQDQIAFADQSIESVPIAGPWLKEQAQNLRGGIAQGLQTITGGAYQAPTKEQLDQYSAQSVQNAPVASMAGQAFGTVAPLAGAGLIPGVSRALGMTGGLASQLGFGVPTGAAISALDTGARGGDLQDMTEAGAIGGGVTAAIPLVGRGLSRLLSGGISREAKNLGRALTDDAIDPATINQRLGQVGDGAMVMDLGPNLQAQAGALASVPGQAQKTLRAAVQARAKDASKRVGDDLAATVGTGPEIGQMTQQIIAAQKATAKPLYDAVRDEAVDLTGNLRFVLQTPMGKEAFEKASIIAKNDGYGFQSSTVGLFDYMKQALDDIVSTAKRQGEGNRARQAAQLATILKKEVDAQVPGYQKARAAFAGPAQVLDAVEAGQTVLTKDMSPGQLQSMLSDMTDGEKAAMVQSLRASLEAQLGNAVNDALSLRNLLKKGWNEQKLRMLLGSDITDELMKRVNREAMFGRTAGAVDSNSETARRQASQEEVAPDQKRIEAASVFSFVLRQINKAWAHYQGNAHGKSNAKLAEALTSGQVPPRLMAQTQRAMKPKGRAPVPLAALPLLPLPGDARSNGRKPIDITIYGGGAP